MYYHYRNTVFIFAYIFTGITTFSLFCKAGLVVTNSLSFYLSGKVFLSSVFEGQFCSPRIQCFWLAVFLVFQHFKYIIPFPSVKFLTFLAFELSYNFH